MKTQILAILIALSPFSALAETPSKDLFQVTRALVSNPEIVNQLHKNNTAALVDVKMEEVSRDVNRYQLVFHRNCFCQPLTATVSILEDLTPTYRDGPIKYTSSVDFKAGR